MLSDASRLTRTSTLPIQDPGHFFKAIKKGLDKFLKGVWYKGISVKAGTNRLWAGHIAAIRL